MPRFKNLDCLKAVAIFGVLTIHAPAVAATRSLAWQFFNQFNRFAVPCFFLVSGFFFARSWQKAADGRTVVVRYVLRLALLFLFWAVFYAVAPPFKTDLPYPTPFVRDHLAYIVQHPRMFILAGYVLHLWFISSLIQGLCLVWLCLQVRRPGLALAGGGALFAVALLGGPYAHAVGWKWVFDMKEGPFFSTLFVALGALTALRGWRLDARAAAVLAVVGLLTQWTEAWLMQDPTRGVAFASHDFTFGTLPYAAGVFFLLLALPDAGPSWLAWAGTCSLGIYVLHIYVQKVLLQIPAMQTLAEFPLAFLGLLYLLALGLTAVLRRLPCARRLVA